MLNAHTLALVATIAAYVVAASRLFNVARPLYAFIPAKYQPLAIALGAGLPQLADALLSAKTGQELVTAVGSAVVAFLVAAKGVPHDPPPGDGQPVAAKPAEVFPQTPDGKPAWRAVDEIVSRLKLRLLLMGVGLALVPVSMVCLVACSSDRGRDVKAAIAGVRGACQLYDAGRKHFPNEVRAEPEAEAVCPLLKAPPKVTDCVAAGGEAGAGGETQ